MPPVQLMGMLFESLKQPVINGYLVAGAIVGPGGLQLIKELVQVGGVRGRGGRGLAGWLVVAVSATPWQHWAAVAGGLLGQSAVQQ